MLFIDFKSDVYWLKSRMYWLHVSHLLTSSQTSIDPSQECIDFRSVVYWLKSVMYWFKSVIYWLQSVMYWLKPVIYWLQSVMHWLQVSNELTDSSQSSIDFKSVMHWLLQVSEGSPLTSRISIEVNRLLIYAFLHSKAPAFRIYFAFCGPTSDSIRKCCIWIL